MLGAVQGITEFVPVSSSAHLVLFPYLFDWDYNGLSFDVALHFGTFLAVIAYLFLERLVKYLQKRIFKKPSQRCLSQKYSLADSSSFRPCLYRWLFSRALR